MVYGKKKVSYIQYEKVKKNNDVGKSIRIIKKKRRKAYDHKAETGYRYSGQTAYKACEYFFHVYLSIAW